MRPGRRERLANKAKALLRYEASVKAAKDAVTVAPVSPLLSSAWQAERTANGKMPSLWRHQRTRAKAVKVIKGEGTQS